MKAPVVNGLWIGAELPPLSRLCIRSFLEHGFHFRLFSYRKFGEVPAGTELADASEILPEEFVFIHKTGSLAHAADWFRYRYLERHGGTWTDMDIVCLKAFNPVPIPCFALQEPDVANIGFLAFPARHPLISLLVELAADPSLAMPWDDEDDTHHKVLLRQGWKDPSDRRVHAIWGATGPTAFTKAVRHFGLWDSALPPASIYPVDYREWELNFDGSLKLSDPIFADSLAIHLWGELLRREPHVLDNLAPDSVVAELMRRHGIRIHAK